MKWMASFFYLLLALPVHSAAAPPEDPLLTIVKQHHEKYSKMEHFSAIQVALKVNDRLKNYPVGLQSLSNQAKPVSKDDLFNIGSITKSFTAALAVKTQTAGKLQLRHNIGDYLNNYPHWSEISLRQLLNMTSGLPNYSDSPKFNYLISKNLKQFWKPVELLSMVYSDEFNPPLKTGYFYNNSGYLLMGMMVAEVNKSSFNKLMDEIIIKPLGLKNTFYPLPSFPAEVLSRMVHGYGYNVYSNPELLGQDVTQNNLSWAGAAGAMVANAEDVVHWVEELFIGDRLFNIAEKKEMQSLVSVSSGKPISDVNADEPGGFGLGIIKAWRPEIGDYWFYEGETLGYRAFYMYKPCNKIIISALFNSATNSENDHGGELMMKLYQQILKKHPALNCRGSMSS